jgi:hypothetical protein
MKIFVAMTTALALLVGGCVSQQSQKALADNQAACNAGNPDACTAAGYQAQANQQEQQSNAAIVTGIGSAILAGAAAGAVIANSQPVYVQPVYVAPRPHYWYH